MSAVTGGHGDPDMDPQPAKCSSSSEEAEYAGCITCSHLKALEEPVRAALQA